MEIRSLSIRSRKGLQSLNTSVFTPTCEKNKNGVMFNFSIEVVPSSSLSINVHGSVAKDLKKIRRRAVLIMSNLNGLWKPLGSLSYNLISTSGQFRIMDAIRGRVTSVQGTYQYSKEVQWIITSLTLYWNRCFKN